MICLLTFYKLTIIVDDTSISFRLGIGLFSRKYRIDRLKDCKPVRNSFLFGIGIRMLPNGWLYNVTGLEAIELSFKNKNTTIRVGTNKSHEIADNITNLIKQDKQMFVNEGVRKETNKKLNYYISIICIGLLITAYITFYGNQGLKIEMNTDHFEIEGMYGFPVKYNEISLMEIVPSIPNIELKTNGYAFGKICKGNFRLSGIGNVKLFIHCGTVPYIHLKLVNQTEIFMNDKDSGKTIELYNKLKKRLMKNTL
jgi:hypothetical protein